MKDSISTIASIVTVVLGLVSVIVGMRKKAANAKKSGAQGEGAGAGLSDARGRDGSVAWRDESGKVTWRELIKAMGVEEFELDATEPGAEREATGSEMTGGFGAETSASGDYYSLENDYDINENSGREDVRAEENYGRREEYNAETNPSAVGGRVGVSDGVARGAAGIGGNSASSLEAWGREDVMMGATGGSDYIDDSGSGYDSDSAEDSSVRLREVLGGEFDLRRAVIEAEILKAKYL